jgi:asparagine synthase (glutamine-hydrolysing)
MEDSVRAHLVADVPVGVFLSGGVDSSIVVALMRRLGQREIKTFTIGFDPEFGSYDERPYARQVAELFHTDHHEIVVSPDLEKLVRTELLEMFDEPFGNPAALIASAISQFARQHVKVALAGVGGDELFGGYPRYQGMLLAERWDRVPLPLQGMLSMGLAQLPRSPDRRNTFERARRLVSAAVETPARRYENMTTFIPVELGSSLLAPELARVLDDHAYLPALAADGAPLLDRVLALDLETYLPGDLLTYTDRASMWHSLEVRVPFCDAEVVRFARTVPSHYKINGRELKFILKDAFRELIPRQALFRTKRGFGLPMGEWLVGPLRPLVREFAANMQAAPNPYLDASVVSRVLSAFEAGEHQYAYLLWGMLILNLWLERFHL